MLYALADTPDPICFAYSTITYPALTTERMSGSFELFLPGLDRLKGPTLTAAPRHLHFQASQTSLTIQYSAVHSPEVRRGAACWT
jgi:hypothetical protein